DLHIRTAGDGGGRSGTIDSRITGTDPVRSKLLQQLNLRRLCSAGEATGQGRQTSWSWRHRRSSKDAVSRKQVAVKADEDEPLVLQDRSTDGTTAEFFVAAGRASQWIALWIGIRADWVWSSIGARLIGMPLGVAQSIQEVAVFGAKH